MLDLDPLMHDLDADAPSGEDLEYDPDFTSLTLACQPGEERVLGDSVIPAEEPDYAAVARSATELLSRTRDLRVAVILANAVLRSEGLQAFEVVLRYIRASLEDYWPSVHPQLDAEDDDDPTMRVNAVLGLTDRETVLGSLRSATLADSRAFGRFGLRHLLMAEGEMPTGSEADTVIDPNAIHAAFQDTDPEDLAAITAAVDTCMGHVQAIATTFDTHIGTFGPDLTPLSRILKDMARRLSAFVGTPVEDGAGEVAADLPDEPAPLPSGAPARQPEIGGIASPDDVKRAIDRIVDYYARHEPSSPVPLLLNRARRLVSADFVSIMKDMAPLGVDNVNLIGGLQDPDEY